MQQKLVQYEHTNLIKQCTIYFIACKILAFRSQLMFTFLQQMCTVTVLVKN